MLPIGPLMKEHRVIEKLLKVVQKRLLTPDRLDPSWVDQVVDFIRTYADRCHHGKEENILFRELAKKPLSEEHRTRLSELVQDHVFARQTVQGLLRAESRRRDGDAAATQEVTQALMELIDFYPKHIAKEDQDFFFPVMRYFDTAEKEALLKEGFEFDQGLIHERYRTLVQKLDQM